MLFFAFFNGDYAIWDDYLVFELIYFVFLDALASLELVMRVRGYQIFREIFPSWYLVNRTNGQ